MGQCDVFSKGRLSDNAKSIEECFLHRLETDCRVSCMNSVICISSPLDDDRKSSHNAVRKLLNSDFPMQFLDRMERAQHSTSGDETADKKPEFLYYRALGERPMKDIASLKACTSVVPQPCSRFCSLALVYGVTL